MQWHTIVLISSITLLGYAGLGEAKLYKWVDDKGEVHYGTTIPPEYAQKANTEISAQGYSKKEHERALTKEEIDRLEAEKVKQAEAEKQKQLQIEQDQRLLNSYPSVDAIIMTRDGKINSLETRIATSQDNLAKLQSALTDKQTQIDQLTQRSRPVPPDLANTLKTIQQQIQENEIAISEYRQQQQEIRQDFNEKLKRYKEITRNRHKKPATTEDTAAPASP